MKAALVSDIFLGRIVKAFGIQGELKFHPSEDFWEDVLASKNLILRSHSEDGRHAESLNIKRSRPHGRNYVIRIEGIDDRDKAEALLGGEVFLSQDRIDVERPDVLLPYQLIGMTVKDEDGTVLGEITSVMRSPAHDIYEVTGSDREFLVPAVPEFVLSVDEAKKEMSIRVMPGLIDDES